MSAWTWETLTGADRRSLEELMRSGATPDVHQLLGHTYRGLNNNVTQNSGLNSPLRGIQDFVVLPNPDDHTLVLGRAHFLALRVAYFALQRETV